MSLTRPGGAPLNGGSLRLKRAGCKGWWRGVDRAQEAIGRWSSRSRWGWGLGCGCLLWFAALPSSLVVLLIALSVHPVTGFVAVTVVALGACLLVVCVCWLRHQARKNVAYARSYAVVPALVLGQVVFVATSHIMLGVVTFLIVWGVTDRNTLPSPKTSNTAHR